MTCAPEERPDATPTGHRVGVEDAESEQGRLRAQGVETADTRHAATAVFYLSSTLPRVTDAPCFPRPLAFPWRTPTTAALRHTR